MTINNDTSSGNFNPKKAQWDLLAEQANLFSNTTTTTTTNQKQSNINKQQDDEHKNAIGSSFSFFDHTKLSSNKSPLDSSVLSASADAVRKETTAPAPHINKEIEARKIFYNLFFWAVFKLIKSSLLQIRFIEKLVSSNIAVNYGLLGLEILFGYNIVAGFLIVSKTEPETKSEKNNSKTSSEISSKPTPQQQQLQEQNILSQQALAGTPQNQQQSQPLLSSSLSSLRSANTSKPASSTTQANTVSSLLFSNRNVAESQPLFLNGNQGNTTLGAPELKKDNQAAPSFVPSAKYYYRMNSFSQARKALY